MKQYLNFVSLKDVETQIHPWGKLQWLSEPRVTGTQNMATGYIVVEPGNGHADHSHDGCEEILYILQGEARQTIELADTTAAKELHGGELVFVPAGAVHSTQNIGPDKLVFLAIYQYAGPEAALRADPQCSVIPPEGGNVLSW